MQTTGPQFTSRRSALQRMALGFGGLAMNAMLAGEAEADRLTDRSGPLRAKIPLHLPRAKRVIFLFMHGGPSHVDLFDPKPALQAADGQPLPFDGSRVTFAERANLMRSPWRFDQHGESGIPMSELWQELPKVADDLCMIHSMCETNVAHGGACMKLQTGFESVVAPSMGSWISYGLGTENQNLPSFITICPTSLHGGVNNFGNAFLPSAHAGVPLGTPGYPNTLAKQAQFKYLEPPYATRAQQKMQLSLLTDLHQSLRKQGRHDDVLDDRMRSFELAYRMQVTAPEAMDLASESQATHRLYGLDEPTTENYGRMCLLARRFAERGVRFIQVSHAHSLPFNNEQWDQHSHLKKGHEINVAQIDRPITGLILDLKARGLLEDTLVLWGGEFGRTPTAQKGDTDLGRDHHPEGFTMWMAGGGVKGGLRYGKTDEFGYYAVEDRCTIHDLHATILHLLGLDHKLLTYRHLGRDYRLTDVEGEVAKIMA
ncbi:MAG: DUF1501 domain-containing protein [Aeoliella sp.]